MSSQAIEDFLTKEVIIEKNIVSYRSLSRALLIHVNAAKNALQSFLTTARRESVSPTYLVTGERRRHQGNNDTMDIDEGPIASQERVDGLAEINDGDDVPEFTMMLVAQRDLDAAKSEFSVLTSVSIYSLSPAPILDADLLCNTSESARKVDSSKKGQELFSVTGKVAGIGIKADPARVKARAASAMASFKAPAAKASAAESKDRVAESSKGKEKEGEGDTSKSNSEKPRATNKLDFSKAKKKEMKQKEKDDVKPTEKATKKEEPKRTFFSAGNIKAKPSQAGDAAKSEPEKEALEQKPIEIPVSEKPVSKRGTKRKSAAGDVSDADPASESSSSSRTKPPQGQSSRVPSGLRVEKGVVLSDEEDEAPIKPTRAKGRRRKLSPVSTSDEDSEAERKLKAMMEVDDDTVVRVTRSITAVPETPDDSEPAEDEDANMEESDVEDKPLVKSKPKRKAKKTIPLGRNGVKKRRVMKTRSKVDDKGYMVTEDYSSYESVGEEEEPAPKPKKAETKSKALKPDESSTTKESISDGQPAAKLDTKPEAKADSKDTSSGKRKPKPKTQKNLMTFFGGNTKTKP